MSGTLSCIAEDTIEALEAFWVDSKAHQTYALYEVLMTVPVSLVIALLAGLLDTQLHRLLPGGETLGRVSPPCGTTEKHWLQRFGRRQMKHEEKRETAKYCILYQTIIPLTCKYDW